MASSTTDTTITDTGWVRQSFLVKSTDLATIDQTNRFFTTASLKYTDTTPGGNIPINPPAQWTRYADPKAASRKSGGKGMGISYSEMIDDHSQVIHMRFGVPEFNTLSYFLSNFYNSGAGQLARTGRAEGAFYQLGRAAGYVAALMSWKVLAFHIAAVAATFFANKPNSRFYYLKPSMPTYWQTVQTIVNQIAVNKGIIPRVGDPNVQTTIGDNYQFSSDGLTQLNALLPDIFFAGGGIDVYSLANRAKRLERQQHQNNIAALDTGSVTLSSALQSLYGPSSLLVDQPKRNFLQYLDLWNGTAPAAPQSAASGSDSTTGVASADSSTEQTATKTSQTTGFFDFLEAELDDGSAFVSFRVNSTGPVTDTFSSDTADSELQQKINSMSSQNRSTRFDIEGGNLAGGVIGSILGGAASAVTDFVSGAADSLGVSGLAALGGSAFVDIPKHWSSSTANLARSTYTINLVSPYGNPVSQLLNLYVPLAMLIAGALPLATGPQSWTSPFLCELYDRGRCQIRLGIIDSFSITRGTGNLGFDHEGNAMGIDVSFSVVDLSAMVYLPITQGLTQATSKTLAELGFVGGAVLGTVAAGPVGGAAAAAAAGTAGAVLGAGVDAAGNVVKTLGGIFDGDNSFTDYMAVLGSLGLADQIYMFKRLKLNLTMQMAQWKSWLTPSHFASFAGELLPARMVGLFFKGVDSSI
ncbi:hypothetical protein [Paraburkholderia sp. BCC1886]|uniref:hypothetical protein n=1 Tax=Paraburkholderia sp. BCC1886 TaxID=2562670 RepID=UPI0011837503|nr:hypothetical protein [Paraburkholderia sp. BCC1886]